MFRLLHDNSFYLSCKQTLLYRLGNHIAVKKMLFNSRWGETEKIKNRETEKQIDREAERERYRDGERERQ